MDKILQKKQEFISYCLQKDTKIPSLPIINPKSKLEAVLIEFRLLSHLSFIIKNAIYRLGSNWAFTIVCGNNNYDYLVNLKKNINRDIRIIRLDIDNMTREDYSIMLLSSDFYKRFHGEKLLIYQEDTIILKALPPYFLQFNYIGAPFSNKEIGNGGLSLRSRNTMIQICERFFDPKKKEIERIAMLVNTYKIKMKKKYSNTYFNQDNLYFFYKLEENILEDLQITNKMRNYQLGKLPSFEEAKQFSIEKFYHENAFGGHQFWYSMNNVTNWLNKKLGY